MTEKIKERPACPFYGFHAVGGIFIDQQGNQCPFRSDYSSCIIDYNKQEVKWDNCPIKKGGSEETLQNILNNSMIFPNELSPEGKDWVGIPLREWYNRMISPKRLSL